MENIVPLHILAKAEVSYWLNIRMYEQKNAAERP